MVFKHPNLRSALSLTAITILTLLTEQFTAGEIRNWTLHPAIAVQEMPPLLYAIGDIHGDYERMIELLSSAKLIAANPEDPRDVKWIGGKASLVITGDFIDKYDRSLDVIAGLRSLQSQAEKSGGHIIITLGNHESEFLALAGSTPGTSEKSVKEKKQVSLMKELKAAGVNPADVAAGTDALGLGDWMRDLPVAAKVGDWFFCHAGNTGGRTIDQLESELEKDITAHGFGGSMLSDPNSILQARMHPRQWWDATADVQLQPKSGDPTPPLAIAASEKRLRDIVEPLGCKHLVIGHQPGKIIFADGSTREAGRIIQKFNGLFYMIDTGMSRGANSGRGALLKIETVDKTRRISVVYVDGTGEPL